MRVLTGLLCVATMALAGEVEIHAKDASGGAVPSAKARLRNAVGAVLLGGTTGVQGSLTLRGVEPGRYWIEVTKDGFQPHRSELELGADGRTVDVTLGVAELTQSVVVSAARDPPPKPAAAAKK